MFTQQVRHNLNQDQSRQVVFYCLLRRLHDYLMPATARAPLDPLTSFVVSAGYFFGGFLRDAEELVASVMSGQHLMAPTDSRVQKPVRTLLDQHYPALFAILFPAPLVQANPPLADLNTMWSHLDGYRTNKTTAVTTPPSTGPTTTRPIGTAARTPQQHWCAPQ